MIELIIANYLPKDLANIVKEYARNRPLYYDDLMFYSAYRNLWTCECSMNKCTGCYFSLLSAITAGWSDKRKALYDLTHYRWKKEIMEHNKPRYQKWLNFDINK